MSRYPLRTLAIALIAAALAGCSAKSPGHPDELKIKANRFLAMMEAKAYAAASGMVHPRERVKFIEYTQELGEKTTFTESRIQSLEIVPEEELPEDAPKTAKVIVTYKYFTLPSTTVKKAVVEQTWQYYGGSRRQWFLRDGWAQKH